MGVSFAAKLRRGSIRTCSAACFRRAHARCVCVPSPSTGSGHRKCGNATDPGRRCTDPTRGFSGRLWDWAFSNPVTRTATTTATAPTTTATTELAPQPVTASEKSQKAAASQNRRDRGSYDASAWRQHSDYGRGRGYGRDYAPRAGDPSREPLSRPQTIATFGRAIHKRQARLRMRVLTRCHRVQLSNFPSPTTLRSILLINSIL